MNVQAIYMGLRQLSPPTKEPQEDGDGHEEVDMDSGSDGRARVACVCRYSPGYPP